MRRSPGSPRSLVLAVCLAASALACSSGEATAPAPAGSAMPAAASATPAAEAKAPAKRPALVHEGGALARAVGEDVLYVADEDRGAVQRVALPLNKDAPPLEIKVPGPPAAVLALDNLVLVTVRGVAKGGDPTAGLTAPGLLLLMRPDKDAGLVEAARVELPADAWGIAVTPDEATALVTSAWSHKVSAVDIAGAKRLWSVDVAREPRGVVALPDGKSAYVTHLVRAPLTRLDGLGGEPKTRDVRFPAAPIRTIPERADAATLSYAAALSPDGSRLFVGRQALGAFGTEAWNGQATVDVLLTADEAPLAQRSSRWFMMLTAPFMKTMSEFSSETKDPHVTGLAPPQMGAPFIQPRALLYRKKTRTLLVASEGTDALVELDALSMDPALGPLRIYNQEKGQAAPMAARCGAPSGIALSGDEMTAYVLCRTTREVVAYELDAYDARSPYELSSLARVSLGKDPLPEKAAYGRRLFYDATDGHMSGFYACAGCHPEGRDDGHVWHEQEIGLEDEIRSQMLNAFEVAPPFNEVVKGSPRQTPMLAGRVSAAGPYGWKGRSPNLKHRVLIGFNIHRWLGGSPWGTANETVPRAEALVEFLRKGLVPPPREAREASKEERRGEAIFNDPNVGCAACHIPKTEYTHRGMIGLGEWALNKDKFEAEFEDWRFKTPSLLYVGGTPPYYHDGSAATLEDLVERNGDRMGHTKHLSSEDRAALVAFMRTL